ncbi:hypothetical protein Q7C36_022547 [Tachysurus vachellii]|uniref:Ig-like domain-containing protein n=1 Tax=Tachysurus vachellii TaxID=175792 RepID=A0AA88ILK2_TACVA|nr:hypothetical protein Q7C36_022547 [Tachysurus vachellii]
MARFVLWTVYCCLLFGNVTGELLCKRELLKSSNVSAELQSDVLLPCNFDPVLLGSDKTADVAVVWKQINTTTHGLLEISQHGVERFWNNRDGRIKHFPKLSASGNFSILLKKVQSYDLGLYSCELHHGTNCLIGYQEIQLSQVSLPPTSIDIIAGAGAAAALLCLFLICSCEISNKRKQQSQPQPEGRCENCLTEVMYTLQTTDQP